MSYPENTGTDNLAILSTPKKNYFPRSILMKYQKKDTL